MTNHALSQPAVDLREAEGVWWITFDRPEASNAFTLADLDRLAEIFEEAGDRPRAAVLTGAGTRSFSAGMHLAAFADLTPARAREFIVKNRRLLASVRTAPFPTIAAINGHCLGTGLGLALVSDVRIAVPHATFGLPEIKVGVPHRAAAAAYRAGQGQGGDPDRRPLPGGGAGPLRPRQCRGSRRAARA